MDKVIGYCKIENYGPLNLRAKNNGILSEWVKRKKYENVIAFGNTKKECMEDARRYLQRKNN